MDMHFMYLSPLRRFEGLSLYNASTWSSKKTAKNVYIGGANGLIF